MDPPKEATLIICRCGSTLLPPFLSLGRKKFLKISSENKARRCQVRENSLNCQNCPSSRFGSPSKCAKHLLRCYLDSQTSFALTEEQQGARAVVLEDPHRRGSLAPCSSPSLSEGRMEEVGGSLDSMAWPARWTSLSGRQ
jgi:hypothetical protein